MFHQHKTNDVISTRHDATRHDTTRHDTTQHNTTQHDTTQHNKTQHNTSDRLFFLFPPLLHQTLESTIATMTLASCKETNVYNTYCSLRPYSLPLLQRWRKRFLVSLIKKNTFISSLFSFARAKILASLKQQF